MIQLLYRAYKVLYHWQTHRCFSHITKGAGLRAGGTQLEDEGKNKRCKHSSLHLYGAQLLVSHTNWVTPAEVPLVLHLAATDSTNQSVRTACIYPKREKKKNPVKHSLFSVFSYEWAQTLRWASNLSRVYPAFVPQRQLGLAPATKPCDHLKKG